MMFFCLSGFFSRAPPENTNPQIANPRNYIDCSDMRLHWQGKFDVSDIGYFSLNTQPVRLTWHQPVFDLAKSLVDHDHFVKGPDVAAVVDDITIAARTVGKVAVAEACFVPAQPYKRTASVGDQPVARSKCDDVNYCCDEADNERRQNKNGVKRGFGHGSISLS